MALVSTAPPIGSRATNPTASEGQSSCIAAQPGTSSLEGQLTPTRESGDDIELNGRVRALS